MDWANVTKIHTPLSANTIYPPDEHALYKNISRPGRECILMAALLLVLTKRSTAARHRMPEEILRMPKVVADIAQRGGNVIIIHGN